MCNEGDFLYIILSSYISKLFESALCRTALCKLSLAHIFPLRTGEQGAWKQPRVQNRTCNTSLSQNTPRQSWLLFNCLRDETDLVQMRHVCCTDRLDKSVAWVWSPSLQGPSGASWRATYQKWCLYIYIRKIPPNHSTWYDLHFSSTIRLTCVLLALGNQSR